MAFEVIGHRSWAKQSTFGVLGDAKFRALLLIGFWWLLSSCGGMFGADAPDVPPLGEFQAEILEDGIVEEAEYERAVLATLQCLVEEGGQHSEVQWIEGRNGPKLHFTYTDAEAYDGCLLIYSEQVQSTWARQSSPSSTERREREQTFVTCMKDIGMEVESFDSFKFEILPNLSDAEYIRARRCMVTARIIDPLPR